MKNYFKVILFVGMLTGVVSCSTDPKLEDNEEVAVVDARSMTQLMAGAYHEMVEYHYMGRNFIASTEVMSDNAYANGQSTRFQNTSRMDIQYTNEDDSEAGSIFKQIYQPIALANIIIHTDINELLNDPTIQPGDSDDIHHVLGEAYAMRALAHFDLLRLYGQKYIANSAGLGITYKKEYKGEGGENQPRGSIEENVTAIYDDIASAISEFRKGDKSGRSVERTNLTLDAAYALETRVGIYLGGQDDYQKVKDAAEELLGKYALANADEYVDYWKQTTPGIESIFELAQSSSDNQGAESLGQIFRGPQYGDVVPFSNFIEDAEFDSHDVRASEDMLGHNVDNAPLRNVGKYPHRGADLGIDNVKIFRYSEVILNYAEALYKTNESDALRYLNELPKHRNATPYSEINMDNLLKERRKEFYFEGFRFFDLARAGRDIRNIDSSTPNNHGLIKWGSYNFILPIPRAEMDSNSQAQQNPGYGS